jgi:hypothetical protein
MNLALTALLWVCVAAAAIVVLAMLFALAQIFRGGK